jgi:hypothetical protein
MINGCSAYSLAEQRYDAKAVLNTYELCFCGDILYITNSFCKNVLNIVTH